VRLGQQTALDPALGAVGGIGPRFFPRPAGPSSSRHPYSTTSSPALAGHHTVPRPLATAGETLPLAPTAETDHALWSVDTSPWRLRRPTDTRSAARRKSRRRTVDPGFAACPHQNDACYCVWAVRVQALPTTRRTPEILLLLRSLLPAFASFLSVAWGGEYQNLVIRIGS